MNSPMSLSISKSKYQSLVSRLLMAACIALFLLPNLSLAENSQSTSGIALDQAWKLKVYKFAEDKLQHSAWGLAHYERNYLLAKQIAKMEKIVIDPDVLFASAFLHDMGVFEPYVIQGAEHSKTAVDRVESILAPTGFPMEKIDEVKASILSHMYYAEVSESQTARVLHDADTLDFLGSIGIARILSLTTRHAWAKDLPSALKTIDKFNHDLPSKLIFASSKKMALERVKESSLFVKSLRGESYAGTAL